MLNKYSDLKKNGTNAKTEIVAGITTFLAAMYVIVVNSTILCQTGMPFNGVLTATILVSLFSTLMMGLYAKNPILVAPGMGLNAFFTYSVVLGMGVKWETHPQSLKLISQFINTSVFIENPSFFS
jgi:AGZA family xanthine/uracil permease-like MFS transporter